MTVGVFELLTDYDLKHLPAHLVAAQREHDLHRLLALETAEGRNAWHQAKETAADDLDGYMEDVKLAWRTAETSSASEPDSLVVTARYALITASLNSSAAEMPFPLVLALISSGIWNKSRALGVARRLADPFSRSAILVDLACRESDSSQKDLATEALQTISMISDAEGCARQIVDIARILNKELILQAVDIADSLATRFFKKIALGPLIARRIELGDCMKVIRELRDLSDPTERAEFWIASLPYLQEPFLSEALASIESIPEEWSRSRSLIQASAAISETRRAELLDVAFRLGNQRARANALSGLVSSGLSADRAPAAIAGAVAAIRAEIAVEKIDFNILSLSEFVLRLLNQHHGVFDRSVMALTMDLIERFPDDDSSRGLLASSAWWLDGKERERALARSISSDVRKPQTTVAKAADDIASHFYVLDIPQLAWGGRVHASLSVLPKLVQLGYEKVALQLVRKLAPRYQTPTLADLSPHLSDSGVSEALHIVREMTDPASRAAAAPYVATRLSHQAAESFLGEVVKSMGLLHDESEFESCATAALVELANLGQEEDALDRSQQITNESDRLRVLSAVLKRKPSAAQAARAIEAVRLLCAPALRLEGLSILVERSIGQDCKVIINEVYNMAFELCQKDPGTTFVKIIPVLLKLKEFDRVVALAKEIGARLSGDTAIDAEGRTSFTSSDARTRVCGLLAQRGERERAISLGAEIVDPEDRFEALLAVVEVAKRRGGSAVEEVLARALRIPNAWARLDALSRAARFVHKSNIDRVEREARAAQDSLSDGNQKKASYVKIVKIIGALGKAERAITEAVHIEDEHYRAEALAELVKLSPVRTRSLIFKHASSVSQPYRAQALEPFIPYLNGSTRIRVATEVLLPEDDELPRRAWLIARAGESDLALDRVLAVDNNNLRYRALVRLSEFVHGKQLSAVFIQLASIPPIKHRPVFEQNAADETWSLLAPFSNQVARLPKAEATNCWRATLRNSARFERSILARNLAVMMPAASATGGAYSIRGILEEFQRVQRWWP